MRGQRAEKCLGKRQTSRDVEHTEGEGKVWWFVTAILGLEAETDKSLRQPGLRNEF